MTQKYTTHPAYLEYLLTFTILLSVYAGCIFLGPRMLNMDGDLGRHITIGNYMIETGTIPTTDKFSHTMFGEPFTPHEWVAEILFALANKWMQLTGVVLLTGFIIGISWYLLSKEIFGRSRSFYYSLVLILLGIAASSIHWLSRPHIFTFLFLVIWVQVASRQQKFYKKLIILFTLMVVWVNFHGAFITGIVYLVIDLIGYIINAIFHKGGIQKVKTGLEKLFILIAAIGAIFLNPVGYWIIDTVFDFLQNQYLTSHTFEYHSPNFMNPAFWPYGLFIVISITSVIILRKYIKTNEILQLISWCVFGLISARNIPLAIIIGLPIISKWYGLMKYQGSSEELIHEDGKSSLNKNLIIGMEYIIPIGITIAIIGSFVIFPKMQHRNVFQSDVFPVQASEFILDQKIDGNVFNEFVWGGYLLYKLWPDQQVFIDGQTDFYGEGLTRQYESIYSASDNYGDLLENYKVSWIIVKKESGIATEMASPVDNWILIYEDGLSVIYQKK